MTKRFTLLSELGRGGMGVVWKARDEDTGQIVALKVMREIYAEDADYVARFERELELAKRIGSVHVVKVLGYGVREKIPYLALEYVDGPSLHAALVQRGPFSWPETRALLIQLAQGLADANAAGVIHRDVKPSNVLLGPDGVAKLTDFGIARGLDLTRMTATSTLLGTPAYMAPEGPKDARSDIYSLGIIGYELLTGAVPFKGTSYQEVVVDHIRTPPDLSKLPAGARSTIGWLLEKDPAARPQRASELLPVLYGATQAPQATVAPAIDHGAAFAADQTAAPAKPAAVEPAAVQPAAVQPTPNVAGTQQKWIPAPPPAPLEGYRLVEPRRGRSHRTALALGAAMALVLLFGATVTLLALQPGSSTRPSNSSQPAGPTATTEYGPTALAAYNSPSSTGLTTLPAGSGPTTVGSMYSDAAPKAGFQDAMSYCAQHTSVTPRINTIDRSTFQDQVNAYLSATPDDIFTWFSGYRMKSFATQGLATNVNGIWATVGSQFSSAYKTASTASDGSQYLLPLYSQPWVVMYRKSVFAAHGYTVPQTLDQFVALASRMQADGLVPIAFGDRDGWPAMGIFDILDMRMNGYDFHVGLLEGKEKWTDPRVKAVFQKWAELMPYMQGGSVGRVWQDAAQALMTKQAGMFYMGAFATAAAPDQATLDDLGLFPFPVFGNRYDAEMGIDAPVEGLMISKSPTNIAADNTLLQCLSTGPAELAFLKSNTQYIAANRDADTSGYTSVQKQMSTIVAGANKIAQFFDRDSRPDFAGANGMQAFLTNFLKSPNQNLDSYLASIQSYWNSLSPQTV